MEIEDIPATFNGIILTIDKKNGKTIAIERLSRKSL
jgi:calcineurin-like phosphoesterase